MPYPYEFSSTNQNPVITSANTGFSGNYYVTVTDTHGCTNTDVVNVVVNENITPDFDQFGPYCEGEEMYVLPNSSDNGVTGTWNPAAINTNIIGTTTYTFTPDEGQCAEIITMDIEVLPSPTASFTISGCPVINTSLSILNNSYDANSYQWYVNNEYIDVAPGADPNIILAEPGYHCIKLVATNECGSDTYSTVIFVNSGICACDESDGGYYNYDYTDGYTIFSNSTETWSSTETIYVQGDIFIQSNAILIIGENTRIEFAPDGRIIVEAGGKLIIESNVVLTGLSSDCQNMWQGIEVWGDNDNVYSEDAQGIVEIHKDNVKIEHAHIGILSGARNMDYICDPETNPFDDEPGSGLVRIGKDNPEFNNPEFYNNGIGIKFLERDPIIYMGLTWSGNILYDCNFSSDELRDYHYSTTSTNPYPNAQNPWAGYANSSRRTDAGINIEGIYRMNITNCNFDNLQHGILSFDSKYNVFNCNFTNAHFGIKINNVNSGVDFNHEISRCFFDRIPGYEPPSPPYYFKSFTAAIYIMAGKNDYIHDNTFGYMDTYQEFNQYGIFTSSTSSFRITENLFKKFKHGIKINNSGEDGGFIGAEETNESYWYGNRFNASWRSITTGGDNSKLKLKCNVCDNNLAVYQPELYDVNYMTYGVLADQGYPPYQGWQFWNVRKPAGNEFYPENEPNYKTLWSNYSYTYYRHNGPPEVIPYVHDESPEWINIDGTNILNKPDNDVACLAPFLIPLPLPILITSNPGGLNYPYNQLDSLKQVTDSLKLVLEDINASLDNGKTYQLLDAIYGNTPPGQLKNKLMKNSPLSDTVIYALLTEYPLPHGNFKNVMDINLPVRKGLRSLLYSVLQQIPQGIANQLYALQANYPGSMTPGRIEQEIDNTETERQLLLNHILILLNDTVHNRRDDAIFLLENEESLSADKILISTYIADGDYDLAASKLAALPTNDHDNADFVTLHQMLLSHYEQGNTLYQLDSSEIDLIRTLAYQCPVNLASANAQSILYYLFREVIPECPAQMGAKNMPLTENHPVIIKAKKDNPVLEDNYPDPATVYTIMPYYLPEGSLGKIEIHDLQGRLLASYKLSSGKNQVYVDTKNLYPGVYLYSLNINGVTYITKKFVVQ